MLPLAMEALSRLIVNSRPLFAELPFLAWSVTLTEAKQPVPDGPYQGEGRYIAGITQIVTSDGENPPSTHGSWVSGLLSSRQHAGHRRPAPSYQLSARTTREVDA